MGFLGIGGGGFSLDPTNWSGSSNGGLLGNTLSGAGLGVLAGNLIAPGVGGMLVGGLLGSQIGGGIDTNATNTANVNSANSLTEYLSNTSYQRGMADMKAAGLNPIMAYAQGGASTPNIQAPQVSNPFDGAAASAVNLSMLDVNKAQVASAAAKQTAEAAAIPEQVNLMKAQADQASASAAASKANALSTMSKLPLTSFEGKAGAAASSLMDSLAPVGHSAVQVLRTGRMPDLSFGSSAVPGYPPGSFQNTLQKVGGLR